MAFWLARRKRRKDSGKADPEYEATQTVPATPYYMPVSAPVLTEDHLLKAMEKLAPSSYIPEVWAQDMATAMAGPRLRPDITPITDTISDWVTARTRRPDECLESNCAIVIKARYISAAAVFEFTVGHNDAVKRVAMGMQAFENFGTADRGMERMLDWILPEQLAKMHDEEAEIAYRRAFPDPIPANPADDIDYY